MPTRKVNPSEVRHTTTSQHNWKINVSSKYYLKLFFSPFLQKIQKYKKIITARKYKEITNDTKKTENEGCWYITKNRTNKHQNRQTKTDNTPLLYPVLLVLLLRLILFLPPRPKKTISCFAPNRACAGAAIRHLF